MNLLLRNFEVVLRGTSRAQMPQLHDHRVLFETRNVGVSALELRRYKYAAPPTTPARGLYQANSTLHLRGFSAGDTSVVKENVSNKNII